MAADSFAFSQNETQPVFSGVESTFQSGGWGMEGRRTATGGKKDSWLFECSKMLPKSGLTTDLSYLLSGF